MDLFAPLPLEPLLTIISFLSSNPYHFLTKENSAFKFLSILVYTTFNLSTSGKTRSSSILQYEPQADTDDLHLSKIAVHNTTITQFHVLSRAWHSSPSTPPFSFSPPLDRLTFYHLMLDTSFSKRKKLWNGVCQFCYNEEGKCWCSNGDDGCDEVEAYVKVVQLGHKKSTTSATEIPQFKTLHDENRPSSFKHSPTFTSGLERILEDGVPGEIKRDAIRTYTTELSPPFFGCSNSNRGTHLLADCLLYIVGKSPVNGYCQGQNFVVANLIFAGLGGCLDQGGTATTSFTPSTAEILVCISVGEILLHLLSPPQTQLQPQPQRCTQFRSLPAIWSGSPLHLQLKAATLSKTLIPSVTTAPPLNNNDDFEFDVFGVLSTQFWTTLGGYFIPPSVYSDQSSFLDFLFLFGEGGGYALLAGIFLARGDRLRKCEGGEEIARELRNWKCGANSELLSSAEIKQIQSRLIPNMKSFFETLEEPSINFTREDVVRQAEDSTRVKVVDSAVNRMMTSMSIMNRGKSESIFEKFIPNMGQNPQQQEEVLDLNAGGLHTEQFLMPTNSNSELEKILSSVSNANKIMDDDFKILIEVSDRAERGGGGGGGGGGWGRRACEHTRHKLN